MARKRRTVAELQDRLDRDMAWRKVEITTLQSLARINSSEQRVICRAGQVILYAHWEGFFRHSVSQFIEFVFSQGKPLSKLKPEFLAISIFSSVKRAAEAEYPGSKEHHRRLATQIVETMELTTPIPNWSVPRGLNTSTEVLQNCLESICIDPSLGLDQAAWSVVKVFIDEQLLKERHQIAHGEGRPVDRDVFFERASRIVQLLEALSTHILDAATGKLYEIGA